MRHLIKITALFLVIAYAALLFAGCYDEDEEEGADFPVGGDIRVGPGGHGSFWHSGTHGGK
jgi:hypothetical protein